MVQVMTRGQALLGLLLVLGVLQGCAALGEAGAKMHGLKAIPVEDCRHAFHTNPCQAVEKTP